MEHTKMNEKKFFQYFSPFKMNILSENLSIECENFRNKFRNYVNEINRNEAKEKKNHNQQTIKQANMEYNHFEYARVTLTAS